MDDQEVSAQQKPTFQSDVMTLRLVTQKQTRYANLYLQFVVPLFLGWVINIVKLYEAILIRS